MQRRLLTLWLLLLMVAGALTLQAQGAPEPINAALSDLSSRTGQTVQLGNLEQWRWEQRTFESSALGCPQDGETYDQQPIIGYVFTLTYGGTVYEYHVSSDQSIVRVCAERSTGDATPTPQPGEGYSNALCPLPATNAPNYPRSRVAIDTQATGLLQLNRLRENPSTDALILQEIPGNAVFTITGGPQCDDEGIVWWQVDYDGIIGWTAEAQGDERYIMPQTPNPLPPLSVISAGNAAAVTLLTRIQGNLFPALDISPDGSLLAVAGGVGSDSVHLYQTNALDTAPRYIDQDETLLSLDMHPNGTQVLVGTRNGGAHLWNLAPDAALTEALYLQTHLSDVRGVQVAPAGNSFASAGSEAQVASSSVNRAHALLVWDIASLSQTAILDDPGDIVLALNYAPAGNALAAVDAAGALYLWSLSAPDTPLTFLDAGASAVVYSPNGQFLAVGHTDGSIDLRNPTTGDVITTYTGHLGLITDLQFSPDNTLLASSSGDGTLRLWSTQSDSNLSVIDVAEDGVLDIAFAPDGRFIAAASEGAQVDVFGVRQIDSGS